MVKPQDKKTLTQLFKYAPEEFKLRLLQFLNNIYRENCMPNEWRKAVITPNIMYYLLIFINRTMHFLYNNELPNQNQFGFTPQKTLHTQL
jgi:hypothetical protein